MGNELWSSLHLQTVKSLTSVLNSKVSKAGVNLHSAAMLIATSLQQDASLFSIEAKSQHKCLQLVNFAGQAIFLCNYYALPQYSRCKIEE